MSTASTQTLNETFDRVSRLALKIKADRDALLIACRFALVRVLQTTDPDTELVTKLLAAVTKADEEV